MKISLLFIFIGLLFSISRSCLVFCCSTFGIFNYCNQDTHSSNNLDQFFSGWVVFNSCINRDLIVSWYLASKVNVISNYCTMSYVLKVFLEKYQPLIWIALRRHDTVARKSLLNKKFSWILLLNFKYFNITSNFLPSGSFPCARFSSTVSHD